MARKKVAVLIAVYNRLEPLRECLTSLHANDTSLFDIFLIDNGSKENVKEVAREFKTNYLRLPKNKFVSYALNTGFKQFTINTNYPYTILMGSDVRTDPHMIKTLVYHMDRYPKVGITGPSHYQITTGELLSRGLSIHPIKSTLVNTLAVEDKKYINHFHSLYVVRSAAFDAVAGFDDVLFPMIYEEPDLGERILQKNYTISPCPQAKIWHPIEIPNGHNKKHSAKKERLHNTNAKTYLFFRNRIIYMSLYSSLFQFVIFYLFFNPIITAFYLLELPRQNYHHLWLGLRDGSHFALTKNRHYIATCNTQVLSI